MCLMLTKERKNYAYKSILVIKSLQWEKPCDLDIQQKSLGVMNDSWKTKIVPMKIKLLIDVTLKNEIQLDFN